MNVVLERVGEIGVNIIKSHCPESKILQELNFFKVKNQNFSGVLRYSNKLNKIPNKIIILNFGP